MIFFVPPTKLRIKNNITMWTHLFQRQKVSINQTIYYIGAGSLYGLVIRRSLVEETTRINGLCKTPKKHWQPCCIFSFEWTGLFFLLLNYRHYKVHGLWFKWSPVNRKGNYLGLLFSPEPTPTFETVGSSELCKTNSFIT